MKGLPAVPLVQKVLPKNPLKAAPLGKAKLTDSQNCGTTEKKIGKINKGNIAVATRKVSLVKDSLNLRFDVFQKCMAMNGTKERPIILKRPDKPNENIDKPNLLFLRKYNDNRMKNTAKMSN